MTTEMERLIAGLPDQLRWAAVLPPPSAPSAEVVVVCGMGGSGIAGDFAAQVAAGAGRLVLTHKGYGLPAWAGSLRPLVVGVSYSGNTEETISAVTEAAARSLPVAVVTGGGRLAELSGRHGWPHVAVPGRAPPRAALGWLVGSVLALLHAAGVLPPPKQDLEEAAGIVEELVGADGHGVGRRLADDLAEGLVGRVAIIHAAEGLTAPPAQRWKTQINENAKAPAWWSLYPELDHNEILGWDGLTRRSVGVVTLRDAGEHARVGARVRLTTELTGTAAPLVGEVWSQGESPLARMLSLAAMGDLVSVALAERLGHDPMPYQLIEVLKERLTEEP